MPGIRRTPALLLSVLLAIAAAAQPPSPPDPPNRRHKVVKQFPATLDFTDDSDTDKPKTPLQPLQAHPFGDRIDLTGTWLFHDGSNPDYASPTFDDHDWHQIDTTRPIVMNGLFKLNEVWYRRHIHIVPGTHDLALTLADFGGSYRIYANGQELGGHGNMSRRGDYLLAPSATFPIPDNLLAQPDLVIVIHGFVGTVDSATLTLSDGISRSSSVYLGPAAVLYRDQQTYYDHGLTESVAILALWVILFILAVGLSLLLRGVSAYPLLATLAGGHLISLLLLDYGRFHFQGRDNWIALPISLAMMASELSALEFARNVAGSKRRFVFTAVEVIYVLCYASLIPANLGILPYAIYSVLAWCGYALLLFAIFLLILVAVRRRQEDAYLLAAFAAAYVLYLALWKFLHYVVFDYAFLNRIAATIIAKLPPSLADNLAIVAAFLTIVVVRTLRLVRERAAIATELQAARTMQQLLLARSSEPTPGFLVDTAYHPAGDVGGDFFLVSLTPGGALSAIVGDVSGKGMMAAMRVSMILGVLRREPSRDPATVLASLNDALLSQADTGFTTACCLLLHPNGEFSVANAGHIAPYLAARGVARELETPPALPLGLAPDQTYATANGRLFPGERLVLMSDGVPEARSAKGELYGFERLLILTPRSAREIADTALTFGQEDDITVLTLACAPPTTRTPPPPPPPLLAPPPPPPLGSTVRALIVAFTLLLSAASAHARTEPSHPPVDPHHVDGSVLGAPIDLTAAFLLKPGDDPSFASPALDDSGWQLFTPNQPLSALGIQHPDILWYRTHVTLPASARNLAIDLRQFNGSYQVFVNGVSIGSSGPDIPGGELLLGFDRVLPIPDSVLAPDTLTIAIRGSVGRIARTQAPGFNQKSSLVLSTAGSAADSSTLFIFREFTSNFLRLTVDVIVILIAIALAFTLRSEREYLALAIGFAALALANLSVVWTSYYNLPGAAGFQLFTLYCQVTASLALIEFVRMALSIRRSRLIFVYESALAFAGFVVGTYGTVLSTGPSGISPNAFLVTAVLLQILFIPYDLGLPVVALWVWWRRKNPDGLLLFFPLLVQAIYSYWTFAVSVLGRLHLIRFTSIGEPPVPGFFVGWNEIADFFFAISILIFLVLRTVRLARARAILASEMAAAATVQNLLLARSTQSTPGFLVETVYQPASEVGGDFFLVSPGPDGSLLVIVGDVSGKGLTAALRVAMILGVLRRETSRDPAEVLNCLNEALLPQGSSDAQLGFTTACCVRISREGLFSVANAGHIAPYFVSGRLSEGVASPPSLPLGLAPSQTYDPSFGQLAPGDRLILMSDGVPEARSPKGTLYGFEALATLTLEPAEKIASTAVAHGQEDDITVLSVALTAT